MTHSPFAALTITLSVPGYNDGCWGAAVPDDQVPIIARNYATLAEEYARRQFPGATVDVSIARQPGDLPAWAYDEETDTEYEETDTDGPVYAVTEWMSRHWTDEPLWEPGFDAGAYLDSLAVEHR